MQFQHKPTMSGEYMHYYSKDPALDSDNKDFDHAKWCETGEEKFLPVKNGAQAVEFILRHLTSRERKYLQDVAKREGEFSMAWGAVAFALQAIEPWIVDDKARDITRVADGKMLRVCDADMDLIADYDDGQLFYELAARIFTQSFGNPT